MSLELFVTFLDPDWPRRNASSIARIVEHSAAFVARPSDAEFWLRDPRSPARPYDVRVIRRDPGLLVEGFALTDAFWVATRQILDELGGLTPIEVRNDDGEPYRFTASDDVTGKGRATPR